MSAAVNSANYKNEYGYTQGLPTKLKDAHNEYGFEYDGWGSVSRITVNGAEYGGTSEYRDCDYSTAGSNEALYDYRQSVSNGYAVRTICGKDGKPVCVKEGTVSGGVFTPVKELARYVYDGLGRIGYTDDYAVDGAGIHTEYGYDAETLELNEVVKSKPVGSDTGHMSFTLEKDGAGRAVSDGVSSWNSGQSDLEGAMSRAYGYEKQGGSVMPDSRLKQIDFKLNGKTGNVKYGRDGFGRVNRRVQGDGNPAHNVTENIAYHKPAATNRNTDFVSGVSYSWNGGSGRTDYTYDERGNVEDVIKDGRYTKYGYDKLNRLIREDNHRLGLTKVYAYDANGNITGISEYLYGTPIGPGTLLNLTEYVYDGTEKDRLIEIKVNGVTQDTVSGYDTIGNPCGYKGNVLQWERGRRLAACGDIEYTYDGGGIRQSKTLSGGSVIHYFTDGGRVLQEYAEGGSSAKWYYYDATGVTGMAVTDSPTSAAVYRFAKNIFGDVERVFDENGYLMAQYEYDAWGNHKAYDGNGNELDYNNDPGHIAFVNPFRYRGYYFDRETGLYYLESRYYDPETRRFINADGVGYIEPLEFNGMNLYAYCLNDPIGYADPTGHAGILAAFLSGLPIFAVFILAAIIVGALVYFAYLVSEIVTWAVSAFSDWLQGLWNTPGAGVRSDPERNYMDLTAAFGWIMAAEAAGIGVLFYEVHRKNARKSTRNRHEEGQATLQQDQGGEKGDAKRIRNRLYKTPKNKKPKFPNLPPPPALA